MAVKSSKIVPNDKKCDFVSTKPRAKSMAESHDFAPGKGESNMANSAMPDSPDHTPWKRDEQNLDA